MTIKIALVGRPNVGKSTLFNRLVGRKSAIVHDQPGVTRDWKAGRANLFDLQFDIMDTPGLSVRGKETLESRMTAKAEEAIQKADAVLFIVDALVGLMPEDTQFAKIVRKTGRPVILVANKTENTRVANEKVIEFSRLGFGEPVLVSAEHGLGIQDLADSIRALKIEDEEEESAPINNPEIGTKPIKISIIGRPNSGKSSIVNWLIGEERLLTGPEAGITRDSNAIEWEHDGINFQLIDTAGLRRRSKVEETLEILSTQSSIKSLKECHIAIMVLDATCPLENQDLNIASLAIREGRAVVLACNKIDLIKQKKEYIKEVELRLEKVLAQAKAISLVPTSATHNIGKSELYSAINRTYKNWNKRISTNDLNEWLKEAEERNPAPIVTGRRVRIKYATQIRVRPPTFVLFSNMADKLPPSYEKYLINSLRVRFDMPGVPIRIKLKESENPYAGKGSGKRK